MHTERWWGHWSRHCTLVFCQAGLSHCVSRWLYCWVLFPLQVVCMMDFHQASEGTFLHHANWLHHQWLTSDLLTDENAGGITVEVILCKYSRQIGGVVKLKPLGGLLQTGSRAISSSYTRYATFLCYCHEPWCYPGATPWQCTSVVGVVVEAVEAGVAVVAVVVGTGSSCSCSCW